MPDENQPGSIVLDTTAEQLYWTDHKAGFIQRANLDQSIENLVVSELESPFGLALDRSAGKMYWSDYGTGKIQRSNLDGSDVEDLVTGLESPFALALDPQRDRMYWTDTQTGQIQRASLDGSNVETLPITGLNLAFSLALDVEGGKLYWTDTVADKIMRANLNGSRVEELVVSGVSVPYALALDVAEDKMYWTDGIGRVRRANLNGSRVETLVDTEMTSVYGMAIVAAYVDPAARHETEREALVALYNDTEGINWTNSNHWDTSEPVGTWHGVTTDDDGNVIKLELGGNRLDGSLPAALGDLTKLTVLDLSNNDLRGVVPSSLAELTYLEEIALSNNPLTGCIPRELLDVRRNDLHLLDLPFCVGSSDGESPPMKLYWTDVGKDEIKSANLDGSDVADLVESGLSQPSSVAIDESSAKMYWTDSETGKIQRANLDGSGVQDLISSGLGSPFGLALDVSGGQMYWTDYDADKIQRANLDGSEIQDLVYTGLDQPLEIALDVSGEKMYWTDIGTGEIQRASLDGSNVEVLMSAEGSAPAGLALDIAEDKMYWTDIMSGTIRSARPDGSDVRELVSLPEGSSPTGLALDLVAGKMYWTESAAGKIQRANLDGSGVDDVPIPGLDSPYGIAIAAAPVSQDVSVLQWPQLYWVDEETGSLQRTSADNSGIEDLKTGLDQPGSIALDPLAGKVYWTDDGATGGACNICRANLDGSGFENLKAGLADPVGIALDLDSGYLYWADRHHGGIYRSNENIHQPGLKISADPLVNDAYKPYQIALDTVKGYMYWTERDDEETGKGQNASNIRRANLDGGEVKNIDFENTLLAPENPFGLALDPVAGKMYWTERSADGDQIRSADLVSEDDQVVAWNIQVVISSLPYSLSGITWDPANGKIYWTDEQSGAILRADPADPDGTIEDVATDLSAPEGIAINPQRAALRALYEATDGENWTDSNGWLSDAPIGQWRGVTTDNDGRVTALRLGNNQLNGTMPPELGDLAKLSYMDFGHNQLRGSIPPELGNLAGLEQLNLSENGLINTIPAELSGLENLVALELHSNYLSGPIPPKLGGLAKLEILHLHDNQLGYAFRCPHPGGCAAAESIPEELGNLTHLETLNLSGNQLTGRIPMELADLHRLRQFDLSDNQLEWIEFDLGELTTLERIDFSNNWLTGPIAIFTWANLSNLKELDLSDNLLEWEIPGTLGELGSLERLDLGQNGLLGTIPPELGKLTNLRALDLADQNQFRGRELTSANTGGAGSALALAMRTKESYLHGPIPSALGDLENLEVLDLSGNRLNGEIPPELSHYRHICFSDRYPYAIGDLGSLQRLDLSDNALEGEIPVGLCGLTNLKFLDLSENNLEGTIPTGLVWLDNLIKLELDRNQLTGTIPSFSGNLGWLQVQVLDLQGNSLIGKIPENLGALPLRHLDIYDNDFEGCVPMREAEAKRLGVHPGLRGLPDELCPPPEEIAAVKERERQGLKLLYLATTPGEPRVDDLRDLFAVKFRLNRVPAYIGDDTLSLTAENMSDREILDQLSDEQIISIWIAMLQRLYAPVSIEDPYRWDVVVDRYVYADLTSGDEDMVDVFKFPQAVGHTWSPNDLIADFRRYAGWKRQDNWTSDEDVSTWYGVTTNDDGHVIGLNLGGNNLIGHIPQDLMQYLPNLQWLDVSGNLIRGGCVSPDLLRPMLMGELISLRPDTADALLQAGEDLSAWSNEELYNDLVAKLAESGQGNETPWDTLYRTVLLNNALETADAIVSPSNWDKAKEAVGTIPEDSLQKGAQGFVKYFDPAKGAKGLKRSKLVGPFIKIANRTLGFTPMKQGVALCAPLPPTEGLTPLHLQNYDRDREALVALYKATGGLDGHWENSSNWNTDEPLHEWNGVRVKIQGTDDYCNQEERNCRVTELHLGGNGLNGTIPPLLGSLGELKILNLSQNNLYGSIPPELGNLHNLEVLALNDNQLTNNNKTDEPIPPELGNLSGKLEEFNLQNNNLTGWLPQELSNLSLGDLRKMDMDRGVVAEKEVEGDVTVDCVGGLCGCLPAHPELVSHDNFLAIVNTGVMTAITWPVGGPLTKGAGLVGKLVGESARKGALNQLSWSLSFRVAAGAGKYQMSALTIANRSLGTFNTVVIKGRNLSKAKAIGYSGMTTVLAENALGAFAEPVAKGLKWWDPEIVGPAKERVFNEFQKTFGRDVGGDIVMEGVWCGG